MIARTDRPGDARNPPEPREAFRRYTGRGLLFRRAAARARLTFLGLSFAVLRGAKRAFDATGAVLLLATLSPLLLGALLVPGTRLARTSRLGRFGAPFEELSFALAESQVGRCLRAMRIHRLPALINILRGDLSFVGPRAADAGDFDLRDRAARMRYDARPGLVCLWWLRKRSNIHYDDEAATDGEYVSSHTLKKDLGILLRSVPASLYGSARASTDPRVAILRIPVDNFTMAEAVEAVCSLARGEKPSQVCFVNAHCANIACSDEAYRAVL